MHILLPPPRPERSRRARRRAAQRSDRLVAGIAAVVLVTAILLLSGCFSLSHDAPPQQHYVLGGAAAETRDTPRLVVGAEEETAPTLVGLRPPRLADYLANPYLVVRHGTHRVEFSEFHRWGEDLGRGINGTLALLLSADAPGIRAVAAPWPTGAMPEYLVQLQVLRFEGVVPEDSGAAGSVDRVSEEGEVRSATGSTHLRAAWEIIRALDGATVARGTTDVRDSGWTVGDHAGLVQRLDEALGTLASDLAEALARVPEAGDDEGIR
ncbi:PqiC family protein [soil metagenome]